MDNGDVDTSRVSVLPSLVLVQTGHHLRFIFGKYSLFFVPLYVCVPLSPYNDSLLSIFKCHKTCCLNHCKKNGAPSPYKHNKYNFLCDTQDFAPSILA
jgi:hypothetical protein